MVLEESHWEYSDTMGAPRSSGGNVSFFRQTIDIITKCLISQFQKNRINGSRGIPLGIFRYHGRGGN